MKQHELFNKYVPSQCIDGEGSIITFTGRVISPLKPTTDQVCIEDIAHALGNTCRFSGHVSRYYCVTPDTKILKHDLTWVDAGTIKTGDELWGFDENNTGHRNLRKWRKTKAVVYGLIKRHCFKITLEDGTELKCSDEHPLLVSVKMAGNQKWLTAKTLHEDFVAGKNRYLPKFVEVWDQDMSYASGWLAGMFDGEGSLGSKKSRNVTLAIAQNAGSTLDKIKDSLRGFGARFSTSKSAAKCKQLVVTGGLACQLSLIGKLRPDRLLDKMKVRLEGKDFRRCKPLLKIVSIEDIGEQDVVAMECGTHTYISNGLGSHNSVAEHCIRVSRVLRKLSPAMGMLGLLHDATEAYLTDIPRPYKHLLVGYKQYEAVLADVIFEALGMPFREPFGAEVKDADELLLAVEQYELMPDTEFWPRILSKEEHSHYVKEYGSLHCMGNMMATDVYMHEYLHLQDLMHDEIVRGTNNHD